jgi:hypothetical protein
MRGFFFIVYIDYIQNYISYIQYDIRYIQKCIAENRYILFYKQWVFYHEIYKKVKIKFLFD